MYPVHLQSASIGIKNGENCSDINIKNTSVADARRGVDKTVDLGSASNSEEELRWSMASLEAIAPYSSPTYVLASNSASRLPVNVGVNGSPMCLFPENLQWNFFQGEAERMPRMDDVEQSLESYPSAMGTLFSIICHPITDSPQ
jgi:hypothetical protein